MLLIAHIVEALLASWLRTILARPTWPLLMQKSGCHPMGKPGRYNVKGSCRNSPPFNSSLAHRLFVISQHTLSDLDNHRTHLLRLNDLYQHTEAEQVARRLIGILKEQT